VSARLCDVQRRFDVSPASDPLGDMPMAESLLLGPILSKAWASFAKLP